VTLFGADGWGDMKNALLKLGDNISSLPLAGLEGLHNVLQGGAIDVESMKALGINNVDKLEINADGGHKFDFDMAPDGMQKYVIGNKSSGTGKDRMWLFLFLFS